MGDLCEIGKLAFITISYSLHEQGRSWEKKVKHIIDLFVKVIKL